MKKHQDNEIFRNIMGSFLIAALWTIVFILSLYWNINKQELEAHEYARVEARSAYTSIVLFRRWFVMRKQVYVPITFHTKPNPYLKIPERDIRLPTGQLFTLINPAYMTRQINELQTEEKGILGHITSLKPLRPQNNPDPWETAALKKFEKGHVEVSSLERMKDKLYMRLMKPLTTEKGCLRCHGDQGYTVGDTRGGLSIAVPMAPLFKIARENNHYIMAFHGFAWLLGIVGLFFWTRYALTKTKERTLYMNELLIKDSAIAVSTNAIVLTDIDGKINYANDIFFKMWRFEDEAVYGKSIYAYLDINDPEEFHSQVIEMGSWFGEINATRNDGTEFSILLSASVIQSENLDKKGITFSLTDISMRKNAELALKESEEKLRERNKIMEMDLKIAQMVQKDLLAKEIPPVKNISIDYRYLPVEKVGGDYFEFFSISDDEFGIFIGDVSGHGVAPALFHSLIKSSTEKICREHCVDPSDFIRGLNRELSGSMTSYFVTGIYGIFSAAPDEKTTRFVFSNAGHPPPVLVRKEGTVESFSMSGHIIGIDKDYEYQEKSLSLNSGDRIFFFTDGIPETENKDKEIIGFENKLLELFNKANNPGLNNTLDEIINELNHFKGKETFKDDIVIIGIEIK